MSPSGKLPEAGVDLHYSYPSHKLCVGHQVHTMNRYELYWSHSNAALIFTHLDHIVSSVIIANSWKKFRGSSESSDNSYKMAQVMQWARIHKSGDLLQNYPSFMEDFGQQRINIAHTNSKIDQDSFFISHFDCRFPWESGAALTDLIMHITFHAVSEGDGSPWMSSLGLPLDSRQAPWTKEIHGQQESTEEMKKTFRQSNLWKPWSLQSTVCIHGHWVIP